MAPAPAPAPAPPAVPQKTAMTAELQQLQQQPLSPGRATFYRPMSERMIDQSSERRLSDLGVDKPREVRLILRVLLTVSLHLNLGVGKIDFKRYFNSVSPSSFRSLWPVYLAFLVLCSCPGLCGLFI